MKEALFERFDCSTIGNRWQTVRDFESGADSNR
jgi:hypothetical protein